MPGKLVFEFQFTLPEREAPSDAPEAMRLLVMGDFSGRASRGVENPVDIASRPVRKVDIDNLDQVMARMGCGVRIALDGPDNAPTIVNFGNLDDFHPDQLYRTLATFQPFAATRDAGPRATDADAFADLLGGTIKRAPDARQLAGASTNEFEAMVKNIVGDIKLADPAAPGHRAAVDALIGARMNALLHDPAFSAVEAAWRSLHLLITSLDLDEDLQLHILDVSKDELRADIGAAGGQLEQSALFQHAGQWSAIVGNYTFDSSETDLALLAALGAIGSRAGGPFLAAAANTMLEQDPEADARWQALRASTHARWIGLALPRLLLRLPYGKATDSIEQFAFEEMPYPPEPAHYLWGNAAFACALLLGRAFNERGWDMEPGDELEIGDLPAHTFRIDGEAHLQACAETYLAERAGEAILAHGLMPLLSFKNRNAVRLLRSQSIALPPQALAGAWAPA